MRLVGRGDVTAVPKGANSMGDRGSGDRRMLGMEERRGGIVTRYGRIRQGNWIWVSNMRFGLADEG